VRSGLARCIDDVVFHYVDLLAALGLDRVSVLATSHGGWIAAELASRIPSWWKRVCWLAPPASR